jgi:MFS family permease
MPECDKCVISVLPMVFLMIGYSIYSAVIWSSIPYIVDEKKLMTGFGIGTSAMNIGLSITPLVIGSIYDTSGYIWVSVLLIIFGSLSILTGVFLLKQDSKLGLGLNSIKYSSDTESKDTTPPTNNNNLTLN